MFEKFYVLLCLQKWVRNSPYDVRVFFFRGCHWGFHWGWLGVPFFLLLGVPFFIGGSIYSFIGGSTFWLGAPQKYKNMKKVFRPHIFSWKWWGLKTRSETCFFDWQWKIIDLRLTHTYFLIFLGKWIFLEFPRNFVNCLLQV